MLTPTVKEVPRARGHRPEDDRPEARDGAQRAPSAVHEGASTEDPGSPRANTPEIGGSSNSQVAAAVVAG